MNLLNLYFGIFGYICLILLLLTEVNTLMKMEINKKEINKNLEYIK